MTTSFRAIFDKFPIVGPFLPPVEGATAMYANFGGKLLFFPRLFSLVFFHVFAFNNHKG